MARSLAPLSVGLAACLAAALAPAAAGAEPPRAAGPPPSAPSPAARPDAGDWPKYCGDLSMSGVAGGESTLSPATVPSLTLLWSRSLSASIASSPSVVDGRVYVGDWSGREWALDAATGSLLATAALGTTAAGQCNPPVLGVTSAPAYSRGLLFLAGGDDGFYALDPTTLAVLWRVSLGDNSEQGGYYGWCSPAVVDGVVLQGVSSNCDTPFVPGRLVALDPSTGKLVTSADFTPPGVLGSGVWTSPAVDVAARKVFVATGSATHLEDGHAFSMVRLDLDTLAIEDEWRLDDPMAAEVDLDWGSSPTLFTTQDAKKLVGAGNKDGNYYAFDRTNVRAGPVWSTPICQGGSIPQGGNGTLSTAAFDGRRLYVGGGAPPDAADPNLLGTLTALDPSSGQIIWSQSFSGPVIAPVAFANGVVFSTAGRLAFALDAATGRVLWSARTIGACFGGVAISRGRIYFGDLAGNLYCFSIPN